MTDADRETRAAIVELSRRLRDDPLGGDPDVFAMEFLTWLRGHGWRPTEAKQPPPWKQPRPGPAEDTYRRGLAAARQQLEEA